MSKENNEQQIKDLETQIEELKLENEQLKREITRLQYELLSCRTDFRNRDLPGPGFGYQGGS